jgi:hypothetical protein
MRPQQANKFGTMWPPANLAAAMESAREHDKCRWPLSPVPGCRTTGMSSILEGRMPTRIRVVTGNRCTDLWCLREQDRSSGDERRENPWFLPCDVLGREAGCRTTGMTSLWKSSDANPHPCGSLGSRCTHLWCLREQDRSSGDERRENPWFLPCDVLGREAGSIVQMSRWTGG